MGDVEEVVRRDVHGPHDPLAAVAEVEHVDARRRLLEVAEEHPLAGERVREDRAIDAAVEDRQRRVPAVVFDETWTAEVEEAWALAYNLTAELMMIGASEAPFS